VITARPGGYRSNPIPGAEALQVCGLTADQIRDFVHRWYLEAEKAQVPGGAGVSAAVSAGAREKADALWRDLQDLPSIYDLAVNPLLLTLIAIVHRDSGTLPRNRSHLYAEICRVVLWSRATAKGLTRSTGQDRLTGEQRTAILAEIAYAMMKENRADLGRAKLRAVLCPALERASGQTSPDGEDFLRESLSDGLLIEVTDGTCAFAHKTFQEYLAAVHIRDHQELVADLAAMVSDQWWAETSIFYAAQADADPIVTAALTAGTTTALALATECADVARQLAPGLRTQLKRFLNAASDPEALSGKPIEDVRELAGVLLTRHLRQRAQTSTGTQVCIRPVPNEVYRLFLFDAHFPAPDAPPESPARPDDIALGMRSADATAFIYWANTRLDSQLTYQLPTAAELDELNEQPRIPALPSGDAPRAWTRSADAAGVASLHRTPGGVNSIQVHLTEAVSTDMGGSRPLLISLLVLRARAPLVLLTGRGSLSPDLDLDLNLALDLNRALNLAQDLAQDLNRDLDLDRALNLARDLDLDLALNLNRDLNLAQDLALDLNLAHGLNRDLNLAQDLALDLNRDLNFNRARPRPREGNTRCSQSFRAGQEPRPVSHR
jgi:hypothetical protein